jgi:hypothetical protein
MQLYHSAEKILAQFRSWRDLKKKRDEQKRKKERKQKTQKFKHQKIKHRERK